MSTIWFLSKILLASAAVAVALTVLIALFHPLKFNLKLRGSVKGQRAELWFVYLFRILQIGVIATPHTQDVVIRVLFWKKLLERNQRKKKTPPPAPPAASPKPEQKSPAEKTETFATPSPATPEHSTATIYTASETPAAPPKQPSAEEPPAKTDQIIESVRPEERSLPDMTVIEPEPAKAEPHDVLAAKPATVEAEEISTTVETIEPVATSSTEQPQSQVPTPPVQDTSPLKPLNQVEEEQKKPDAEKSAAAGTETAKPAQQKDNWRQILRKVKRDASNRYRQLQKYLRLARQKWRELSPILKKFWSRGKKGFGIVNPELKIRYALHEPYLTGMMQGTMSVFAGLAGRFGLNFVPIPAFNEPGIYSRGCAAFVIRPWRLVIAALGLLIEKKLWLELWQAFKWYRSKKTTMRA